MNSPCLKPATSRRICAYALFVAFACSTAILSSAQSEPSAAQRPDPTQSDGQSDTASPDTVPPNAPERQLPIVIPPPLKPAVNAVFSAEPCLARNTGATMTATASLRALAIAGTGSVPPEAGLEPVIETLCIPHMPMINWYARFLNGPEVKPLTPRQKAELAAHNFFDPFNLLTIGGEAAISVAADSHSAYGPGFPGWGRYMGVSLTQDMTGEFFGTFLIPSLVHQDPRYHRMPNATVKRRIAHAAEQILWTQSDTGKGMLNYATLGGFALDIAVGDLYVPGQRSNISSSATRYGIALATAPIDNYIIEFLPDLARHFHIQVVVIQRIINQVARTDSNNP